MQSHPSIDYSGKEKFSLEDILEKSKQQEAEHKRKLEQTAVILKQGMKIESATLQRLIDQLKSPRIKSDDFIHSDSPKIIDNDHDESIPSGSSSRWVFDKVDSSPVLEGNEHTAAGARFVFQAPNGSSTDRLHSVDNLSFGQVSSRQFASPNPNERTAMRDADLSFSSQRRHEMHCRERIFAADSSYVSRTTSEHTSPPFRDSPARERRAPTPTSKEPIVVKSHKVGPDPIATEL